jgi:hypothetical protein
MPKIRNKSRYNYKINFMDTRVNFTINYIVYTPGHRRHHSGSQTQLLNPPASGMVTVNDSIPVTPFSSFRYMGNDLPFAFMSVTGASDGSHIYTTPETQNIPVGNAPVRILIVYAPVGGIGGDGYGVWVDAFDVETGDFSDSDFIQVYTNGILDNAKTAIANNDGIVSSDTAEDMRAYTAVDGIPFLEWLKIGGTANEAADYDLQMHENGFVFAFYQLPQVRGARVPTSVPAGNWVEITPGVLVHIGTLYIGPGVIPQPIPWPVDNFTTLPAKLLSTSAILSIASNMSEDVKPKAIDLAVKNLNSIAESIKKNGDKIMQ